MQKSSVLILSITDLQQSKDEVVYEFETPFFEQFSDGDILDGKVKVAVQTKANFASYEVFFHITGVIKVSCTRCNEPINFDVKCEDTCRVIDGDDESDYDGEVLLLHPKHKTVDLTNFLYETIALSLPIQIFHKEGQCIEI